MKSYILMGHGMMQMTEELLKDWNGGNVILNPRVLKEEQLISCSQTYKKNKATVLFDPHFYIQKSGVEKIEIENKDKINILVMHADLDGVKNSEKAYNPISSKDLNKIGFDYIALGHIHNTNFDKNKKALYPGSLTSLGFDELSKHGMIVGNIDKENYNVEYIELKENELKEINVNVSEILDIEELIQKINEITEGEQLYKIVLCGKRKFDINVQRIKDIVSRKNLIKIKNETVIGYDVDKISKENSLRGFFVREVLNNKNDYTQEEIEKAIEIGLENL